MIHCIAMLHCDVKPWLEHIGASARVRGLCSGWFEIRSKQALSSSSNMYIMMKDFRWTPGEPFWLLWRNQELLLPPGCKLGHSLWLIGGSFQRAGTYMMMRDMLGYFWCSTLNHFWLLLRNLGQPGHRWIEKAVFHLDSKWISRFYDRTRIPIDQWGQVKPLKSWY